jgi:hypothetical protein
MNGGSFDVLSGVPADDTGTGRLVAHLRSSHDVHVRPTPLRSAFSLALRGRIAAAARVALGYAPQALRLRRALAWLRRHPAAPLLVLHPQSLGFRTTLDLLEERTVPAALLMLDSSFFCIASYNHVAGENHPCERCVGGDYDAARRHGCAPFPVADGTAHAFVRELPGLLRRGKVVLLAQNEVQARLAQRHFALAQAPAVVGMWTRDWDALLAPGTVAPGERWDVVFHGFDIEAKGVRWLEEVAAHLPARRFLFPMATPLQRHPPENCHYRPLSWETGLEPLVRAASVVAVPSLWSAPVEGALVKSVVLASAVAVAENSSAYACELPAGLVLPLPQDPARAAEQLGAALASNWAPASEARQIWLTQFARQRGRFLERLLSEVPGARPAA